MIRKANFRAVDDRCPTSLLIIVISVPREGAPIIAYSRRSAWMRTYYWLTRPLGRALQDRHE